MPHVLTPIKGVARGASVLAWVLLTIILAACDSAESSGSDDKPRSEYASERERLLATCPAKAQDFFAWQQDLAEERGLNRPVWENDDVLDPTGDIAQNYLATLPADQRGGVGIDSVRDKIIVQVTREEDEVLAELRARVENPEEVTVETVRWSTSELRVFTHRIEQIPDLDVAGIGYGNPNGRVEVDVPGDAEKARQRIAEVVDPCAFKVRGNVKPMRPM